MLLYDAAGHMFCSFTLMDGSPVKKVQPDGKVTGVKYDAGETLMTVTHSC